MDLVEQARHMILQGVNGTPHTVAVYILRLSSGILYVGSTCCVLQRMRDHMNGIACNTTRRDKPEALIYVEAHATFPAARKREGQIKRWSRAKKLALANQDLETLQLLSKSRD